MILINRCYTETTPEFVENGEHSDSGFICEDVSYTFKELVSLLRDHPEASCYPATGSTNEWYGTEWYTDDYTTGTERQETVHYSHDNEQRSAKYWRKAAIAAGIVSSR